jgi:uncharacterized membrane protein YhaH (DUF805 family)
MSKPVLEDLFRFSGRRNRKSYALYSLAQLALLSGLIAAFLPAAANGADAIVVVLVVLLLVAGLSANAVAAQRCRDFGWTGWAILIALLPFVGWIFAVALFFIPGSDGPNRYGPDPLARGFAAEASPRLTA